MKVQMQDYSEVLEVKVQMQDFYFSGVGYVYLMSIGYSKGASIVCIIGVWLRGQHSTW